MLCARSSMRLRRFSTVMPRGFATSSILPLLRSRKLSTKSPSMNPWAGVCFLSEEKLLHLTQGDVLLMVEATNTGNDVVDALFN